MDPRAKTAKRLISQVCEILWSKWDPIGVNGFCNAKDEYDSYAPHIAGLILKGANVKEIASELTRIERDQMGLSCTEEREQHDQAVAKQLVALLNS